MNDIMTSEMSKIWKISESTLNYYNKNAREFVAGTVNVHFTEMQDLFLGYVPEGSTILDFGCGSGRDTKYFLNRGYHYAKNNTSSSCYHSSNKRKG